LNRILNTAQAPLATLEAKSTFVRLSLGGVTQENGALKMARQIGILPQRLVSFSEDEAGRIYAIGYEGMIYQLDFSEARFE
jgi:hypothetical protein